MMYLLSILIPVYNTEKYIKKCLDSLQIHKNKNIQVIIVNDGSTDSSFKIIKKYESFPNVVIINRNNRGFGSTINDGIKVAKGKYFKILDSDDSFSINFDLFLKKLKSTDVDCILNQYTREIYTKNNYVKTEPCSFKTNKFFLKYICFNKEFTKSQLIKNLKSSFKNGNLFSLPTITIKTDIIKNKNNLKNSFINLLENINFTDNIYIMNCILNSDSFIFFEEYLYKYLIGRENQSVNNILHSKNKLNILYIVFEYILDSFIREIDKTPENILFIKNSCYGFFTFTEGIRTNLIKCKKNKKFIKKIMNKVGLISWISLKIKLYRVLLSINKILTV